MPFPRALVIESKPKVAVAISQTNQQYQSAETWMVKKNAKRDDVSGDDLVLAELRTANRLLAILATRGMEQRDAIALLHGMSFPPRAIAAALAITPNAVSIAIHRIKKAETSDTRGKTITEDADATK
jgi:DNA-directed RNA polymerase specialized sigma24 family protein